jgi:hypothetical protein
MSLDNPEPCELAYAAALLDGLAMVGPKSKALERDHHAIASVGAFLRRRSGVCMECAPADDPATDSDDFYVAALMLDTYARHSPVAAPIIAKVANWLRAWRP